MPQNPNWPASPEHHLENPERIEQQGRGEQKPQDRVRDEAIESALGRAAILGALRRPAPDHTAERSERSRRDRER